MADIMNAEARRRFRLLGVAWLAVATWAVYWNGLSGGFVFDDLPAIVENPTIRSFSPMWGPLSPPPGGSSVVGRPVVNLSFALNHAIGGLDPWGYHVTNVLIHLAAGLALFGLIRHTLALPWAPAWLRESAERVSFWVALIWLVHPLQTESVTFVVQRTESLGGMIYLVALYAFARGIGGTSAHVRWWLGLSVAACLIGVATKETVATAPILMLLYDRAFVAGSFRSAWRQRWRIYVLAASSWVLLAWLVWQAEARGGTAAFGRSVGLGTTLLTQCQAIVMYLKLAVWPHPLVVDYGEYATDAVHQLGEVWLEALLLAGLLGFTGFALVARPALGFVAAWFFVILAPSSSFIPLITQARAEHRMYLPLAAVVVLVIAVGWRWLGAATRWIALGLAVALGATTVARNRVYQSELTLWQETAKTWPRNPRAHYNLAVELGKRGDRAAELNAYRESLRLDPDRLATRVNLARTLLSENRVAEAREHAEAAVRIDPTAARARGVLGRALFESGDFGGAAREFREAVRTEPQDAGLRKNLGMALAAQGDGEAAIDELRRAVALQPEPDSFVALGTVCRQAGRLEEARANFEEAVRLQPDNAVAHFHLGDLLVMAGEAPAAVAHYETAVRGLPQTVPPLFNLGVTLRALGRTSEAIRCFEAVLRIDPQDAGAAEILAALREGR